VKRKFSQSELKDFLDNKSDHFNTSSFIDNDPISIPHQYRLKQDIEISGLFAALLAWGQRVTIIRKCKELMEVMGNQPYQFVIHHSSRDLKRLKGFKHRTFNETDLLYFVEALRSIYKEHESLEPLFVVPSSHGTIEPGLINFHNRFFSLEHFPHRTKKHLPTPERKSTCKRINMYLRWMVRSDDKGVDFGLWKDIKTSQLICPLDLHVDRVGRQLKLIRRKQTDWQTALELTDNLRKLDPNDPVKYDFALFGLGIEEGWSKLKAK
jgi:uncharacterized protein (TIGR02757 family)